MRAYCNEKIAVNFEILEANFAKISIFNFLNTTMKIKKIELGIC